MSENKVKFKTLLDRDDKPTIDQASSKSDEIAKLKTLLDDGTITQAEFELGKVNILSPNKQVQVIEKKSSFGFILLLLVLAGLIVFAINPLMVIGFLGAIFLALAAVFN